MVKVVIVDPQVSSRESLAALLGSRGEFAVVGQTGSGLDLACFDSKPDLAVIELDLSECNGISLMKWVRRNLPKTRVLIHCGTFDRFLLRQVLALKPEGVVHKTETLEVFLTALKWVARGETYVSPVVAEVGSVELGTEEALSTRELEVIRGVVRAKTSREIAGELGISMRTVESHRANAMRKLDIQDVVTLTHYALRTGLVGCSRASQCQLHSEQGALAGQLK